MSKQPYIDYDFEFETVYKSAQITTDCTAITILNQGNCSILIDNNGTIPAGGGMAVTLDCSFGIPRLSRRINIVFLDDNTVTPQVCQVSVTRTIIKSICHE